MVLNKTRVAGVVVYVNVHLGRMQNKARNGHNNLGNGLGNGQGLNGKRFGIHSRGEDYQQKKLKR